MRLQITALAWCLAASTSVAAADHYLFSDFKGNGEDGLDLAHSTDYKAMATSDFETWQELDSPMTYPNDDGATAGGVFDLRIGLPRGDR